MNQESNKTRYKYSRRFVKKEKELNIGKAQNNSTLSINSWRNGLLCPYIGFGKAIQGRNVIARITSYGESTQILIVKNTLLYIGYDMGMKRAPAG